jgi:hypothetical protein
MGFLFEYQAGQQKQAAYNYNSDINERNAKAFEQQAEQAEFINEVEITEFREQYADLRDAQAQAFRYNGWLAEEGTPLKVALASAQEADEEIANRRYNAAVSAQEIREQGVQERMQGQLNRMYGKSAATEGKARAFASLINTGSALAGA